MQLGSRQHAPKYGFFCALVFIAGCGMQGNQRSADTLRNQNQGTSPFDYADKFGGGDSSTPGSIGSSDTGGGGGGDLGGALDGGGESTVTGEMQEDLGDGLDGLVDQLRNEGGNGQLVQLLAGLAAQAHQRQLSKQAFAKALLTAFMVKHCIDGVKKAKAGQIAQMNPKQKKVFNVKTALACYVKTKAMLEPKLGAIIAGISGDQGTLLILMKQVFGN